jgi:hypothetical protein
MATHDYVIANGTGAAVRSDLNNALAAIVSNNSGSSAPSTTYAYQWWADTNNNVLKIRNSANNAWITLRELDGTMLIEDGSAAAPGLSFASDTNTGIFRPSNNALAVSANGSVRMTMSNSSVVVNQDGEDVDFRVESNGNTHMLFVDAGNDRIGIGTSSPDVELDVAGDVVVGRDNNSAYSHLYFGSESENSSARFGRISKNYDSPFDLKIIASTSSPDAPIIFNTALTNEACRIDTSGRLLVGTSNARENFYQTTGQAWQHQIEGVGYLTSGQLQVNNSNTALGAYFNLAKSRGTSVGSNVIVQNGDTLGNIEFHGNDGTDFVHAARISAQVDGAPGSNDMPGRITFSTTADGATSPTERMRIDSAGVVHFKNSNYISFNNNGYIRTDSTGFLRLQMGTNGIMFTNNNNSELARIETGGRLLLGTSSVIDTNSTLEAYRASGQNHIRVQSNLLANGEYSMFRAHGIANTNTRQAFIGVYKHSGITNAAPFIFLEQENGSNMNYWTDNSGNFRSSSSSAHIGTTNGGLIGTQTSDLRLKNVGANVGYGLAEVKQLQPKQYALKTNPSVNKLGFIAQEVESIVPEAVFDTLEELDGHQEGDRTKLGMEYVQLIPVLVNAIKELSAEVDTLKTKVAALEAG